MSSKQNKLFSGHFSFFAREKSEDKMETEGSFTILAMADNIGDVVDSVFPTKVKEFIDEEGIDNCFEIYLDSVVSVDLVQLGQGKPVITGFSENPIGKRRTPDILRLDIPLPHDETVAIAHKSSKFGDNIPFVVTEPDEPSK